MATTITTPEPEKPQATKPVAKKPAAKKPAKAKAAKKAPAKKAAKEIDPKAAKALASIPKRSDDGLSDEQVKAIHAAHKAGATVPQICQRTGYAAGMIGYVLYRRAKEMARRAEETAKAEAKAKAKAKAKK